MKQPTLTIIAVSIIVIYAAIMLTQCESPKRSLRENADDSGKERTWNTDIRENADEMLEKGRAVFDLKPLETKHSGLISSSN